MADTFALYREAVAAYDAACAAERAAKLAHYTDESATEVRPEATKETLEAYYAARRATAPLWRAREAAQKAHTESLKAANRRGAKQERDNAR